MKKFFEILLRIKKYGPRETLKRIDSHDKLQKKIEAIEKESRTDLLTGLLNRRGFEEKLEEERERADRYNHPFLVIYLDMDNLKQLNDTQGHEIGDEALISIAEKMKTTCRGIDFAGRVGGDEFILVFPETSKKKEAVAIVERFRKIENVSIGYSQYYPGTALREAINTAERRMYKEKNKKKGAD